jgi:alkylresorcinol/alkylpyrone synthase
MDMTDTTHSIWMDQIAGQRTGAPHIAGTAVALTTHRYDQDQVASVLTKVGGPEFARFARTSGVDTRSLAIPLSRYPELTGFTEANTAYVEVAEGTGRTGRAVGASRCPSNA